MALRTFPFRSYFHIYCILFVCNFETLNQITYRQAVLWVYDIIKHEFSIFPNVHQFDFIFVCWVPCQDSIVMFFLRIVQGYIRHLFKKVTFFQNEHFCFNQSYLFLKDNCKFSVTKLSEIKKIPLKI